MLSVTYDGVPFSATDGTTDATLSAYFTAHSGSLTYTGIIGSGTDSIAGTFTISANVPASQFNISSTNISVALPNNLVTMSGASASLTLDTNGFSGNISNGPTFALGGGVSLTVSTLSLAWNSAGDNKLDVSATGSLNVATGQSLANGTFTFEQNSASDVVATVSGASVSLGSGLVSISGLNATMNLSTSGLKVTSAGNVAANFPAGGATFVGNIALAIDTTSSDKNIQLSATGMTVTLANGGTSFTGDLGFEQITQGNSTLVGVSVAHVDLKLKDQNNVVIAEMTSPAGSANAGAFLFQNGNFAGAVKGSITVSSAGSVSASGDATDTVFIVNTGSDAPSFPDPLNLTNSLQFPTGPIVEAYVRGIDLNISASDHIHGDFGFTASSVGGHAVVSVSAENVSATFGAVQLTSASGTITLAAADGAGKSLSGSVVGTVAFAGGGVTSSGDFSATFDDTGVHIGASNVSVIVQNESFTGSFTVDAQPTLTTFTITAATLHFGSDLLQVDDLNGNFSIDSSGSASGTVSGTLAASIGQGSFSGLVGVGFGGGTVTLSGNGDTLAIGDETITGDFTLTDNGSGSVSMSGTSISASLGGGLVTVGGASLSLSLASGSVVGSFTGNISAGTAADVSFSGQVTVQVDANSISASGTGDHFTVGSQTFDADFTFTKDAQGLDLGVTGVNINLGSGAIVVTGASGTLLIPSDQADTPGISGTISATFSSNLAAFTGHLEVDFAPGTFTLAATGVTLTVAGQTLTGDMGVTESGSDLDFTASNLSANLGGGLVTIQPVPDGTVVPPTTLMIHNGTFSGSFSGIVAAGTVTGVQFSGLVSVSVDSTSITASGTDDVLTIAGQAITANFAFSKVGSDLNLHVGGVAFSVGTLLSVSAASGDLTVGANGLTGSAIGTVTAGISNLTGTLGVGFAPGVLKISGTNDTLTFGNQFVKGDFNFIKDTTGLHLSITNFSADLGSGLVTVSGGSATLNVDQASGAISGSLSGTVASGTTLNSLGISFGGSVAVSVANGVISASGTGDTLSIAGNTFSTSFSFFKDASGLEVSVTGLSFTLGSILSVAGASGTLQVTSAGIVGSTSGNVNSTLAGLSGTLGVGFAPGHLQVSGTNDTLSIGGQSLTGDFVFTADGPNLDLDITNLTANLGGGLVKVSGQNGAGATAHLSVISGVVSGSFNGYLQVGSGTGFAFSGGIAVTVDSGAGTITAAGTGDTLTIGGQSIIGDFTFAKSGSNLTVTIANVAFSLGGILSVSDVHGSVTVGSSGLTGSVAGTIGQSITGLTADSFGVSFSPGSLQIEATNAVLLIGGQSIGGTFDFRQDSTGLHLNSSNISASLGNGLVKVAGGAASLTVSNGNVSGSFSGNVSVDSGMTAGAVGFSGVVSVAVAPGSITASGTNDTLTVAGYQLTTSFSFSKVGSDLDLTISNLNFSLGGALTISNASGVLDVTSAGVTGNAAGTVSSNISGVSIMGVLGVSFAPGTISISGTNDSLVASGQTVSGDFNFTKDATGLHLSASNFAASLGNGLVTVSNGSGMLDVGNGAITGSFSGTLQAGTVGGSVSFGGPINVAVSAAGITASTGVGQTDTLTIGSQTISAGFSFSKSADGLSLVVTDLSATLGPVSLTNGGGSLDINSSGVSGTATGTLATSFTGFSYTGTLSATFAPGSFELTGTNNQLTVGDQSISGDFSFLKDITGVHLTASNLTASFGGVVSITNGSGTLDVDSSGAISGSFGATVTAGAGTSGFAFSGAVTVAVAPGSITATGTNDSLTVLGNTMMANFTFHHDSAGTELDVSGVNLSFANGTIAVNNAGGTLLVTKTGVSGSLQGGLTASIPNVIFNSTNFAISFAPGTLSISGTGVSLTAYGQSISGNFSFVSNPSSVSLHIDSLALSLGGVVNVTNGTGDFTLTKGAGGGMTGSASGNVQIAGVGPDVQFGGVFSVSVGNNTVSVAGTGTYLNIFGQKISGNFSFTKTSSAVDFHVNSLNLNLGNGLVLVTGGAADFTIASGGITGSASGTLSVGGALTGVGFGGTVSVVISPTSLNVIGTNTQITVAGLTLTADQITFSHDSSTGALDASITNLGLAVDGNSLPVDFNGSLMVAPSGFSGTLTANASLGGVTGTVTANFANGQYTITAGVSAAFSENLGPVAISGTIAAQGSSGGSATVSLTDLSINLGNGLLTVTGGSADFGYSGGKISGTATGTVSLNGVTGVTLGGTVTVVFTPTTISVIGTGMNLSVLGQTLSGDFSFVDNGDGTVHLGASNVSVSLANAISLTGGAADFTLGKTGPNAGIQGTGSGNLSVSLPGVGFSTAFGLTIDNTNGQSLFKVAANPMTITVGGIGLTGSFVVQKVTTSKGLSTVSIVASDIDTFLGDGTTGLHISNAGGAILILPTGTAIDVSGSADLEGITGLDLSGTLHVRMNSTGAAVSETIPAPDPNNPGQTINETLTFARNQSVMVSGTAALGIGDGSGNTFVSLSGGFSFSSSATTVGNTTTTKLLVGAAGISAFLGTGDPSASGATGVNITNANLGIAIIGTQDNTAHTHTSVYALTASGAAALLGIPSLTLTGTMAVQSNTAGNEHDEVDVPDPANPGSTIPVHIDFTTNTQAFSGSVNLAIADPNDATKQYLSLSGDFSFTRTVTGNTTEIDAAVSNAQAFIGVGGANPIGVQLTGGSLGLVMLKTGSSAATYALAASGNVAIVGLPGLIVGGTIGIKSNNTGSAQTNPVDNSSIPAGALEIDVNGMTIAIEDSDNNPIVAISIDAVITKTGSLVDINATSATFALNAGTQPLASVTGAVEFTIGAGGFNLGPAGFQILGFSILGDAVTVVPHVATPGASVSQPSVISPATGGSTGSTGTGATITLPSGTPRKLGPLSVYNLAPAFNGFSFSGGNLSVNLGLKADAATLALGSAAGSSNGPNSGGVTAEMTGFQGTLGVAVGLDLSSFRITSFGPTGAFDFHASQFVLNVPNIVNVSASGIDIHYDPKATTPQKILSIDTATITVPIGPTGNGIQGQISPSTDANGKAIPGLQIWSDHLQLGNASLKYIGTLGVSSFLQITNPSVAISNLTVSFNGAIDFDGSITIGADAVTIGPSAFQFTGTSVAATLTDNAGNWGFSFTAGTLGVTVASVVSLSATNVTFNPSAGPSDTLISVASLDASLKLPALTLTGEAGADPGSSMKILGDGTLALPDGFSIGVSFSAGSSGGLGWPSWIPIQISSILLHWDHFQTDKTDFTITFSAHVGGTYGPITLDGDVTNVVLDVQKLINGQFPIVSMDEGSITASGPAFGGTISGTLLLGVVKVDALNHQVLPGAAYDHTIFYAGIEAALTTPEFGLAIRFGISQNGPLEAYVQLIADIPIVPPIGLAIKSLYGGITFDAQPFPNISNASDLKSPAFDTGVELTVDQWEKQLKQEVVNQAGGGSGGYLFAVSDNLSATIAGLDAGNVTSSLSDDFLSYGFVLSSSTGSASSLGTPAPTIVKEVAGQEWLIADGTKYYVLTKDLTGVIEVSKYRAIIDTAATGAKGTVADIPTIVAALNAGSITSDVTSSFQAYGIYLSNSAIVKADAPAPGQQANSWVITDGSFTYHVIQDANGLLTIDSAGGSMSGMGQVIRITAGITLGIEGMPASEFSATGEIVIETDGKLMFNANATFGGVAQFNFKSYIDLSTINSGHLVALFYFEQIVTIPGVSTPFTRLIIAGGVEFGLTDSNNQIIDPNGANAGATAVGFGVKLTGEIDYYALPEVGIKLTGAATLVFTSTQAVLTFNATLSATITSFIQANNIVTAAGAFTIQYGGSFAIWGAAEIEFDSNAIPFLQSVGISANAEIFLRINTDSDPENVQFDLPTPGGPPGALTHESFDLQGGSFGLYIVGELILKKGPIDFSLGGIFSVDFVYNSATSDFRYDMFVYAELKLGIAGQTLLTTHCLGLLEISNDGFAAMLAVQADSGVDTGTGQTLFDFHFNFTMFTNTTGRDVSYTLPSDLTNIIKQQDGATGAGDDGLIASLTTTLNDLSTKYGALVTQDPTTLDLTMTVPKGVPQIDLLGDYHGQGAPGPYFVVQGGGDVDVLNTFTLSGSFVIQASAQGVALGAQATLKLGPIADISASGYINIGVDGVYAALTLSSTINLGGFASFGGAAVLEINTTGIAQTVKEYVYDASSNTVSNTPVDTIIPANQVFKLDVKGQLQLLNYFNLQGEFLVIFSDGPVTTLTIGVSAHLQFFGINVSIGGSALIATDGSNIAFAVDAEADLNVDLAGIVNIDGHAHFQISTFAGPQSVPDPANLSNTVTVQPGLDVTLGGDIKILSIFDFNVTGEVDYNAISHVFTMQVTGMADIDLFIFNAHIGIGGWIDSTGQFAVGVDGNVGINLGIASISGGAYLYVAYMAGGAPVIDGTSHLPTSPPADRSGTRVLTIGGGGHLDIDVFGITLVGIDIDFSVNSNLDIYFHAVAHLNFLLFSVDIGFTVNVGSFSGDKPADVFLGGTSSNGQIAPGSFGGGQLVVNAGSRASNRNFQSSDHNEDVIIQGSDYNSSTGTQTIYVTVDGYTQTFKNVSSLLIPGDGAETINILNTVAVPLKATVGAGGQILNASTGAATLQGSTGNDLIESGAGPTTIIGGGGTDTIVVGTGSANITTTGGTSRVLWNTDTAGSVTWAGASGDELIAAANTPGSSFANGESLSFSKIAANTASLSHLSHNAITFSNVSTVLLSAPGGGNTISVGDLAGAGISTLNISYGQSHTSGNTFSVAGTSGADTYTLSGSSDFLPAIPSLSNLNPSPSTISVPTNTITRTGGLAITLYGTSATSGDSLSVNSKGGNDTFYLQSINLPTTLQGNDASAAVINPYSTYYYVGWQGVGVKGTLSSVTALLSIVGSKGQDVLVMDDTSDYFNRSFSLTATQLVTDALGTGGRLVYDANVDNFNLFAGPAHNKYVVSGTAAPGSTQISGGDTDLVINAASVTSPLAVNGGDNLGGVNTLTINGTPAADTLTIGAGFILGAGAPISFTNFQALVVNGNGGNDTYLVSGSTIPLTINGTAGDESFTIDGNTAPVVIDSGAGHDSFFINGASSPVTITADANGAFTVNGNSDTTTLNGGPGINTFNILANNGTLSLIGGTGVNAANTFNILGNSKILTADANGGSSIFNVSNIASPITLIGGNATATFHISSPLHALINITGGTTIENLIVDGTPGADAFNLTTSKITGAGSDINYTGLMAVTLNGLGGNDSFVIASTNAPTTITAGLGNSTITVQTIAASLTINTGTGISASTINLATNLSNLQGAVSITGTGNDTLNISDASNTTGGTGALTDNTLTGFAMNAAGVTFTGVKALNLTFGSGADNLTVNAVTNTTTRTSINTAGGDDTINLQAFQFPLTLTTGAGTNTINAGQLLPSPATTSVLVKLQGPISINGAGGSTTLNLDNTGDTSAETAALTSTTLTGLSLGPAGITYASLAAINLSLGSGGNVVSIASTAAATLTSLTGGSGNDTFNITSTTGPASINTGSGTNAVNITGLSAVQGAITVTGNGTDTLNVDDSASTIAKTGILTPSTITGFGMTAGGITYNTIDTLNITLGAGAQTVTVNGSAAATPTTLTTGSAADTVTVNSTGAAALTINTGAGNDTVFIHSTTGITTVAVGTGTNTVNVYSLTATLDPIQGALFITGNGTDTINLTDTGSSADKTTSLDSSVVNVAGSATIDYSGDTGLATLNLNLNLGSGVSTLTILTTRASATTNITTGSANDIVTVQSTGGTTNLNTAGGDDSITVLATAAPTTITTGTGNNTLLVASSTNTLDGIQGSLSLVGSSTDTLTINDSGSLFARTGNLSATALTGFGMGTSGVSYSGIATLTLDLGTGGASLTVSDTPSITNTTINGGSSDTFSVLNNHGHVTLNTSAGSSSTITVAATSAVLDIVAGAGSHDTVTVGTNHSTSAIAGAVNVASTSASTNLTVDDSTTITARTDTLTSSTISGLSPALISYTGAASLTILLGSGANTFTVADTSAPTTLTGGAGDESFTIQDNHDLVTLNTGAGTNTVAVQATDAPLNITSPATAINTITLTNAGLTSGITAAVTLTGNGSDTLILDDSADTTSQIVTLTPTSISGIATVNYTGVHTLTMTLGSAADTVTVSDTASATTTNINTSDGDDTLTVTTNSGPLNLNAGDGSNTASILATAAPLSLTTPITGTTSTTIGNAHKLDGITSPVTITGPGALLVDDASNTVAKFVTLSSTQITNAAPAIINYAGLTTLTLSLGTNDDTVSVTSTSLPTAINTGAGSDSVSVSSTGASLTINTGTGSNLVSLSDLPSFNGPVSINGGGFDQLTVDESANGTNAAGTLSSTQITGLSPAPISYNGVATLTVTLGTGSNSFAVQSSSSSTILASGTGTDHVTVGSLAPSTPGVMSNINGPLTLLGNSNDTLSLDDSASSTGKTISVTATRVTGLSPAPVNFDNLAQLSILLGSGADAVTVSDTTAASTSINTGAGNDAVTIDATTNALSVSTGAGSANTVNITTPDDINGPVSVNGTGGTVSFSIDDTANTTGRTVTLTGDTLTGVTATPVTYTNLTTLVVNLGSGSDQVQVTSVPTAATTNLNTGPGNDAVTLAPAQNLTGYLNMDGGTGTNTLAVDLTNLPGDNNLTLNTNTIDGIGLQSTFTNFSSLSTALGAGNNTLTVSGDLPIPVAVTSTGNVATTLAFAGDYTGTLDLPANSTTSIDIGGSLIGILATAGSFDSVSIGQNLTGTLAAADNIDNVSVGQDLTGTLSAGGNINTVSIGHNLAGSLVVGGNLHSLTIGANDSGNINAASIDSIHLTHAQATGPNGIVFSATQSNFTRTIQAISAKGNALPDVFFKIAYDGSAGVNPSAAIRVTNAAPKAERFDLVMDTPYSVVPFDLTRIDSTNGKNAGIRNLTVSGSLLKKMTPSEQSLLGKPAANTGSIYLPKDTLAAISIRRNVSAGTIYAGSIQALAFATDTDTTGKTRSASQLYADQKRWSDLLNSTFVTNAKTHTPYTKVLAPTEPLRIVSDGHALGVFTGRTTSKPGTLFQKNSLLITDNDLDIAAPVDAILTYAKKPKSGRPVLSNIAFTGTGGSVTTDEFVTHISSDGPIGSLSINAGKQEILTLDAPSIQGKVKLFGGKLINA